MAALRVAIAVLATLAVTLVLIGPHLAALWSDTRPLRLIPLVWHRLVARILGLDIRVTGRPDGARPLLLVANHVCWKDIIVLGAVAELSFIAKDEVRGWPVFGWLARLQRTVFVARDKRQASGLQVAEIARRLNAHDVMVLFPEGTTGDGNRLLPFKSSLIGAAKAAAVASADRFAILQPVGLSYTHENGLALGRAGRVAHSWVGDQDLVPHLVARLSGGRLGVQVRFGDPIRIDETTDRKEVTRRLEHIISGLIAENIHGKPAATQPQTPERQP